MTEQEKLENAINGLERFIADFKPFCGNKNDWQQVYDALTLLKAQEPRVMTLEELLAKQTSYVEVNTPGQPVLQCTFSFPGGEGISVYPIGTSTGPYLRYADYLKKWRCWTSHPTDEQRGSAPWEE